MSVQGYEIGAQPRRRPPMPNAPIAEVIVGADAGLPAGVVFITVPPGASMPAHAHGDSHTILMPMTGHAILTDDASGVPIDLVPGTIVTIPKGDKVMLENPGDIEMTMTAVFMDAAFASEVEQWPVVATVGAQH